MLVPVPVPVPVSVSVPALGMVLTRDRGDGALCCAHVPRREPPALVSSFTSLHRTPHRPDPAPRVFLFLFLSCDPVRPGASGGRRSEVKEESRCEACLLYTSPSP